MQTNLNAACYWFGEEWSSLNSQDAMKTLDWNCLQPNVSRATGFDVGDAAEKSANDASAVKNVCQRQQRKGAESAHETCARHHGESLPKNGDEIKREGNQRQPRP